jgi:epoxyqueuosine reductase
MSLTKDIKEFALDIGYNNAGITSSDHFWDHIEEVQSRGAIYDFYVEDPRQFLKGAQPKKAMPSARSIISMVWDYSQKAFPESLLGKIGRIYLARCYNAPRHRINGARYQLMLDFLKKMGCEKESGDVGSNTTLHCKRKNLTRCSPTRIPFQTEIDIAEWEE